MKKILVLGAGRSSSVLINYLLEHSQEWDTAVTVGDYSLQQAKSKVQHHDRGTAIEFDALNADHRKETIALHDIIISMLPPQLHILVAKDCIEGRKHLITASYVTDEMQKLNEDVKKAGLLFLCEMGLDPGIDHMSAMRMIHKIQQEGGMITSFKSGTGGLVAPQSDDNPWHYKVTWNPRNVVLAGQGTAQYLENGVKKFVPYHRLFSTTEKFKIKGYGKFEAYPNRDSLHYISQYGLEGIKTIIRSTLRKEGYCEAWNALIQLGITDDSYNIENTSAISYTEWLSSYLPEKKKNHDKSLKDRVKKFLNLDKNDKMMQRLEWLGVFSEEKIPLEHGTPAQILQNLIEQKWMMQPQDNDMIVMRHEFRYIPVSLANSDHADEDKVIHVRKISSLVLMGNDSVNTGMAKTVGLPMGIALKLLLNHKLFLTGVHIPVISQVYEPVLTELEKLGIKFSEEDIK